MSRPLRYLIALIVSVVAFVVVIKVRNVPQESYYAPPAIYQNATAKAYGKVIGTAEEGFSGHLLSGPSIFDYATYRFQPPSQRVTLPDGTKMHKDYPAPILGRVRVATLNDGTYDVGKYVIVAYDPIDPTINGVPGTVGVWNTSAGYLNPYLWWYVGIVVLTITLQEIIRIATRTNDFRA